MKKLLLLTITLLSLEGFSQGSIELYYKGTTNIVPANTVILTATTPGTVNTITIDVKNTGPTTHTYNVKRYDVALFKKTATDTAAANFCFGGLCFDATTYVGIATIELQPNQNSSQLGAQYFSLDADLVEASVKGFSWVKYTVFNVNNVNDSVQFAIKYNDELRYVGIKEQNKNQNKLEIFPNPAKDMANLILQSGSAHAAKLVLFNSIGAVVLEKEIALSEGKNNVALNLADLSKGVYIAQIKEGASVSTKKLIIE